MKKLFLLVIAIASMVCLFAFSTSAAEFGTTKYIDGMTTVQGLDTTSRVLMDDGVTYPSAYIFSSKNDISFDNLNNALKDTGKNYGPSSVVMIEFPEGCTEVKRTFAGSTTIEYVRFSSTITGVQWGTFLQSTNLSVVEFDEDIKITAMNTDVFASTGITTLKLPNSLTTVNENFLRNCSNLTTISFGENFTQVFNRSAFFAGCNIKTIYMPAGYFDENGDISIKDNFFGWNDRDSNFRNGGVIYYTGTKAQAQYIINKELDLYAAKNESTAVWNTIQLVSLEEYNNLSSEDKTTKCYMVYEYNKCDAFYDGVHKKAAGVDKSCETDFTCAKCNDPIKGHTPTITITYNGKYTGTGVRTVSCSCENAGKHEVAPLFVTFGYAIKNDGYGITNDYKINEAALEEYLEYLEANEKSFEFGIFIGNSTTFGETFIKADGTVDNDYSFSQKVNSDGFTKIKCTVADFTADEASLTLVMGLYVIEDGKVSYIQHKGQDEYAGTVTKGETTLDVVTITKIAELQGVQLPFIVPTEPVEIKEN